MKRTLLLTYINIQKISAYFVVLFALLFYSLIGHAVNLAFYYGDNPPLNKLKLFNNVVLEPNKNLNPRTLETASRKIYAYVSLGEATSLNQYKKPIDKNWIIGKNNEWHS